MERTRDRLPDARLEGDHALLTRRQGAGDGPAEDDRAGFVRLDREGGVAVALGAADDVLQSARQAVGDYDAGDGFAADVAEY